LRIELVKWKDASDDAPGWQSAKDIVDSEHFVESVGWVLKETENYLTLCMDVDADGDTHTRGRIPKSLIVSREILKDIA
jgi:hypothetical protein